ncbi:MAG: PEP-CTERM sorting domain-containing protein [Smithellaceae bacterium]|nr:PEP-CTERM sorting domain-containing protein [Smithellaceae bacterium]
MDQQINLGYTYNSQSPSGNAIYPAFNSDTITFISDDPGFTRHNLIDDAAWWYQYVDLNLAGITTPGDGLDLSGSETTISFDTRFYHDPQTNTNPYYDAPVFLRIYTYDTDGDTYLGYRDYGIVYAAQEPWNDEPYPTWTNVMVNVNSSTFTEGGVFDVTNISRVRFYGTDWNGNGDDFVDFRNLIINDGTPATIPEPVTMILLGLGLAGLAGIRRKIQQ